MSEGRKSWPVKSSCHALLIIGLQIVFIIIFGLYGRFPKSMKSEDFQSTLPLFADVHTMIFVGIAFLLTFLRHHSLTSVTLNILIGSLAHQWYIIVAGIVNYATSAEKADKLEIPVNLSTMLFGDFASATVLVSVCVLLGKTSVLQLTAMTLIEVVLFVINEYVGRHIFHAFDVGDTIFLHIFAAYFGLAVARPLHVDRQFDHKLETSAESNVFSLLGTLLLWVYWPSFSASGALPGAPQERALVNTYLALTSSVLSAVCFSILTDSNGKIKIEHVQNAVLAGGVAIGGTADLIVWPFLSLLIGFASGCLSTLGYVFSQDFLYNKLKIHDTAGVHSLHSIPGLLGAAVSVVLPFYLSSENLGGDYDVLLPEMAKGRTSAGQSAAQALATVTTLGISIGGGLCTGLLIRFVGKLQFNDSVLRTEDMFDDKYNIRVEESKKDPTSNDSDLPLINRNSVHPSQVYKVPGVDVESRDLQQLRPRSGRERKRSNGSLE